MFYSSSYTAACYLCFQKHPFNRFKWVSFSLYGVSVFFYYGSKQVLLSDLLCSTQYWIYFCYVIIYLFLSKAFTFIITMHTVDILLFLWYFFLSFSGPIRFLVLPFLKCCAQNCKQYSRWRYTLSLHYDTFLVAFFFFLNTDCCLFNLNLSFHQQVVFIKETVVKPSFFCRHIHLELVGLWGQYFAVSLLPFELFDY